jgi:branched-subunit amino acid transport protein AzlD
MVIRFKLQSSERLLKYSGKTVSQMIFYMLAKYVPGDIKYIFTKFYRHISTNNEANHPWWNCCLSYFLNKKNYAPIEKGNEIVAFICLCIYILIFWKTACAIKHRTCRTSRFSWLACPGTSKDQQIKIISLLKYSGKTVSQMIFYMLAKYVPGDIKYIFTKFGQASQENLLVRQVLCTSRTSRAWQFHTPGEIAV